MYVKPTFSEPCLRRFYLRLTPEEIRAIEETCPGWKPYEAFRDAFDRSDAVVPYYDARGEIQSMIGRIQLPSTPGVGVAWSLFSAKALTDPKWRRLIMANARTELAMLHKMVTPTPTLINYMPRWRWFGRAGRWLRWMGFVEAERNPAAHWSDDWVLHMHTDEESQ